MLKVKVNSRDKGKRALYEEVDIIDSNEQEPEC